MMRYVYQKGLDQLFAQLKAIREDLLVCVETLCDQKQCLERLSAMKRCAFWGKMNWSKTRHIHKSGAIQDS